MSFFSSSRTKNTGDSMSSKYRAGKSTASKSKRSFRENQSHRRPEKLDLSSGNLHTSQSKPQPYVMFPCISTGCLNDVRILIRLIRQLSSISALHLVVSMLSRLSQSFELDNHHPIRRLQPATAVRCPRRHSFALPLVRLCPPLAPLQL